ncbi:MAG: hypothetical protein M3Y04_10345 [Actinomycetota bacterium]|nr:hypothetical protein [Actinomycetota bacterium]
MSDDRHPAARWRTDAGTALAEEVVARLLAGRPLDDLELGELEGRVDLRGLPFPQPQRLRRFEEEGWFIEELSDRLCFKGARLVRLDLSGAMLDTVRMRDTLVEDCRFDGARCQRLGLVRTDMIDCSFAGADLRQAALGAWVEGGNVFRRVSFAGADFRVGSCPAAAFVDCDFSKARIEKVDFQSSSFLRCRFAGDLREVMFYDHGFKTGKPDANPMEDVDFSAAVLHDVEFRHLNLDRVIFPAGPEHLVIQHYRCALERAIAELASGDSREARRLTAGFEHRLKWAGPNQEVGVFSLDDYERRGGEDLARLAVDVLRRGEAGCH